MAIDWLDVGFNLVIGGVIVFVVVYGIFNIWNQIKKKTSVDSEKELDQMLKIQKLLKK